MRRLLGYVRPYWPALGLSVILMALAGAAQSALALLIRPIFDRVLNPASADEPVPLFTFPQWGIAWTLNDLFPAAIHNVWTMVAIGILAVYLIKGLADYAGNYLVNYVGLGAVMDLRQRVFEHVLRQDSRFFEGQSTGRLMSSIMSDIEKIQVASSHMLADWLRQSFTALGLLLVLLQHDWKLALVSLTLLPFVLIPTARLGKRLRRTTRRAQDDAAEVTQVLQEALAGHQVVKAFGAERIESEKFRNAAARWRSSNLRYVAQQALASPLIEFFGALTIIGLLTYARNQIKLGQMTPGEFTSFVIALLMLYEPVKRLTGIHNIFEQASGASQKVFEYLDAPAAMADAPNAIELRQFRESIVFDRVTFRYPTADRDSLRDVSLEVRAGQVVALVGASGAGKTTLAGLVPRFRDPSEGRVSIDGRDIREYTFASLRSKIGIVAQETFLFDDTVGNNIRYGRAEATPAEVRRAAEHSLAAEFIERLPQGYDTMTGERGVKLSGGQRQRLAIARALLRNAPILILDEATSHLDTESEMLVQKALQNLMQDRTTIVIAHRLSTVRRADLIVVLDEGRIAETGTHDELVERGGIYGRLYALQYLETA
ncbi:MAG: ABC transporter transmembrane domain-containing protein [Bryobacteraceae bacterium]|nr:ABC transporter transmembrane domain-containing protein [Bryobacteraceae bacterium]